MIHFFKYNWQVRADYFDLLRSVSQEELFKKRIGGVGSIAETLLHIIDVEYNWLMTDLCQQPELDWNFEKYKSLEAIRQLSDERHKPVAAFISRYTEGDEKKLLTTENPPLKYGEVMRHVLAHEIHHIGQLSIWVRELGLKPPSANFIERGFF